MIRVREAARKKRSKKIPPKNVATKLWPLKEELPLSLTFIKIPIEIMHYTNEKYCIKFVVVVYFYALLTCIQY